MTAVRIAALFDIHGNLPALEAVVRELLAEAVDEVLVGGDVVPGPMPEACLALLEECALPVRYIRGNGEVDVLDVARGMVPPRVPPAFLPVVRWCAGTLSAERLGAMASWPLTLTRDVPGQGPVLFCHATPRDDNEIFTRLTPEDRVLTAFQGVEATRIVCGHTHMQFRRGIGEMEVVNAGSVGLPFGEVGAHWAMVTPDGISLRNTAYDVEQAVARIGETEYPGTLELRAPPSESAMLALFEGAELGGPSRGGAPRE